MECIQIGDFGMSRNLLDEEYYICHGGVVPIKWTAPEVHTCNTCMKWYCVCMCMCVCVYVCMCVCVFGGGIFCTRVLVGAVLCCTM